MAGMESDSVAVYQATSNFSINFFYEYLSLWFFFCQDLRLQLLRN
jgi:hypothetical protein